MLLVAVSVHANASALRNFAARNQTGSLWYLQTPAEDLNQVAAALATRPTAPTRSSFIAVWNSVGGATGYRLDVFPSRSFNHYLLGYHYLDVGKTTGHAGSGLSPAITYYYRLPRTKRRLRSNANELKRGRNGSCSVDLCASNLEGQYQLRVGLHPDRGLSRNA